jgi:bifunctional DNase/RNase
MFVSCQIWTVARTNLGTAVLIKEEESGKSLPLFVTPLEAQIILNNLGEQEEGKSFLYDFISELCRGAKVIIKRIELNKGQEGFPSAQVRTGRVGEDDFTISLNPSEAVALAARFSCPIHVEETYFRATAVNINLVEIEKSVRKKKLEDKLFSLVEQEEYEKAAEIRDKISDLEEMN